MTFNETQIEAITQGVLQQLRSRGIVVSRGTNDSPVSGAATATVSGGVRLDSKVITEDMLAAAGVAGKSVRIASGTVITPSGHDYIRRHHITVETGTVATAQAGATGVLIVMGKAAAASSAAATAKWSEIPAGCEFDAAVNARKHIPNAIVCCVAEPSTTACLLNRDRTIRAAVITENTDIGILGATMNPHVVCLNSIGWSFAAMLRLLRQMSTTNATPSSWKELS